MQIIVTQEDINFGIPRNCQNCPLAKAITRAAGKLIRVGSQWIHGFDKRLDLPKEALAFREAFDKGSPVEPFTFTLEEN